MNDRVIKNVKIFCIFWIVLGFIGIFQNGFVNFDAESLAASALAVAAFLALFLFLNKSRLSLQNPEKFLSEIIENKDRILHGGWEYHSLNINERTIITQYFLTVSFIIGSVKVPSRFYIVEREDTWTANTTYSLITLLLGWWGIPWGPIYTIQSLSRNMKGGNRIEVGDLLS